MNPKSILIPFAFIALAACGGKQTTDATSGALSGTINIDGSSTVYPITEAVAEESRKYSQVLKSLLPSPERVADSRNLAVEKLTSTMLPALLNLQKTVLPNHIMLVMSSSR